MNILDEFPISSLRRLWFRWTEPSAKIVDVGDRRSARLLATLLLAVIFIGFLSAVIQVFTVEGFVLPFLVIMGALLLIGICYRMSRTVHYHIAGLVASLVPIVASGVVGLVSPSDPAWFAFMSLGPVLASAVLSPRYVTVVGLVNVTATATVLLIQERPLLSEYGIGVLFFSILFSALIVMVSRHRALVNRDREEAIRESEARYRILFENAPIGIGVASVEGRLLDFNDAMLQPGGYTREDIGQIANVSELYYDAEARPALLAKLKLEGQVNSEEVRFRAKDGKPYDISLSLIPINFDSQRSTLAIAEDITQRKRIEEQLRHAQKLEAVGQLTGGVAHEFNNLLTAVTGNLELSLDQLPGGSELHRLIKIAYEAAWRGAGLTSQLLAFSRRSPIDLRPLDLGMESNEVVRLVRQMIDRKIQIETEAETDLWLIMADKGQINQLIINFCVNARDALLERMERPASASLLVDWEPRIQISVENVEVDDAHCRLHLNAKKGSYVRLCVTDNGSGIDEEIRHKIFEPFFTTKEVGRGTGLGLSAVYGIVADHQGWIELESEKDEGTTFRVYFPWTDRALILPSSPSSEKPHTNGEEIILIVDDEEAVRDLGKTILENNGYQVLTAGDGRETIEIFSKKKEEIDLVILDLTMPHLSGKEVLRQLRHISPEIKVIVSSGHRTDLSSDFKNVLSLPKPYRSEDLLRAVLNILQQA